MDDIDNKDREVLVSVIVPVYMVAAYIEACLVSLFAQTYPFIEFIIIDDASPDESMKIANEVIKAYNKMDVVKLLFHSNNKGLSETRNTGIEYASGEYLFFIDSDDVLPPDAIERLVVCLKDDPDFVIGNYDYLSCEGSRLHKNIVGYNRTLCNEEILDAFLDREWPEMSWNKLIKRDFCVNNHLYFEKDIVHEDNLWSFIIATKANKVIQCNEITYLYRLRAMSITHSKAQKSYDSTIKVLTKIVDLSNENGLFQKHQHLSDYIINIAYYLYKEVIKLESDKAFIDHLRLKIKMIMNMLPKNARYNITFIGRLKYVLFSLPFPLSLSLMRIIINIKR